MVPELDIYRSAKLLIDQHGEDAAKHSAKCADALLEGGDMEGRRVWLSILGAIEELQRTRPRRDEGQEVAGCRSRLRRGSNGHLKVYANPWFSVPTC